MYNIPTVSNVELKTLTLSVQGYISKLSVRMIPKSWLNWFFKIYKLLRQTLISLIEGWANGGIIYLNWLIFKNGGGGVFHFFTTL